MLILTKYSISAYPKPPSRTFFWVSGGQYGAFWGPNRVFGSDRLLFQPKSGSFPKYPILTPGDPKNGGVGVSGTVSSNLLSE